MSGLKTKAIHSGQEPDPVTGAVITPIYQTTTFAQPAPGQHKGYEYSRTGNPTRTVLETVLADMEDGAHGFCFASGSAALATLAFALLRPGDHVIVGDDVYGGTYRFLDKVLSNFGVDMDFIDMADPASFEAVRRDTTRMVFLESPTNPLLKLTDLEALIGFAKKHGLISVVDNTFATPYLQQPLTLGADIVLHSMTKYIGGHSDVVGGALILKTDKYREAIAFHQNSIGATPDPFACWLTLRGLKTLGVRMEAHCKNAMEIAQFLEAHPKVEDVIYPGLPSHPQHALAKKQMAAFGGMISLRIKGGKAETDAFFKKLQYFTLAESLGGIESLVEIPAVMTHAAIEPEIRARLGITDNLVRVSVGIEDVEDLKADLDRALGGGRAKSAAA
ncbi:MAG: cystathionine gamma-synthase [Micavibrio sp.]|nr:MAG: cystathionine gamma-synthase [Micavibrio sp.]